MHPPSPFQEIADSLFSVLFPTRCSLCGAEAVRAAGLSVCRHCWASIEPWEGPCCERCGLPIASQQVKESETILCGPCRTDEPDFDLARCFGLYRGNLRALILQLKFQQRARLGKRLGAYLAGVWERLEAFRGASRVLLVPVPLFLAREKERGFNQSRVLAEGLVRHLPKRHGRKSLQFAPEVLERTRATMPQTSLRFSARGRNVRGAFKAASPELLAGRQVVLIDDVMTTGATLSACAWALKRAGAAPVWALALARSTPQFPDTTDQTPGGEC